MSKKRRNFSTEFKLKVILEALKERATLSELCQRYELHPNQISKWKKDFLENAKSFMGPSQEKASKDQEAELERLYSKIGQLQMEVDFLKKKLV